jgi:hypothetical protein
MAKEEFFTLRWNNIITLGLGLLLMLFVFLVFSTQVLSDNAAFYTLMIFGVFY